MKLVERFELKGRLHVQILRAKTGKTEIVYDGPNTIHADLKEAFRDTMNSNVDFALDNLQATQVAQAALSAAVNGKDAMYVQDEVGVGDTLDRVLGMAATVVHAVTPSGNYFRQWTGTYQNLTAGTEDTDGGAIGQAFVFNASGTTPITDWLTIIYAQGTFTSVTLQINDIITFNWKISVAGS